MNGKTLLIGIALALLLARSRRRPATPARTGSTDRAAPASRQTSAPVPEDPPAAAAAEESARLPAADGVLHRLRGLLQSTARGWAAHDILRLSAALSYYAVFSLAPLLVLVVMACGSLIGQDTVEGHLRLQLLQIMGPRPAAAVEQMITAALRQQYGSWTAIGSFLALLFGATGVFTELKDALNRIWGAPENPRRTAVFAWTRTRLLSFGMVVSIMFLLLVSLALSAFLAVAATWFSGLFQIHPVLWAALGFAVAFTLETLLFALIFRVLPDLRLPWRDIWRGAAVTALLFEAGKWLLSWYIARESTLSAYGAAGSLMLLLLWIYYSAVILLTGAEFTRVHSTPRGPQPRGA